MNERKHPVTLERFMQLLSGKQSVYFQIGGFHVGMSQEIEHMFKELTQYIDYECKFVDGVCKEKGSDMCCCLHCACEMGHMDHISSIGDILEMYRIYDEKLGYWSATGCLLPRKYRSFMCLNYTCEGKRFTEWEEALFAILAHGDTAIKAYYQKYIGLIYPNFLDARAHVVFKHLEYRMMYHCVGTETGVDALKSKVDNLESHYENHYHGLESSCNEGTTGPRG